MGEEEMPTHNRVERGQKRAEKQESNTTKLLSLLTKMREDMKRREDQFKEELRWRDKILAADNKRREENLATALKQRDEELRE